MSQYRILCLYPGNSQSFIDDELLESLSCINLLQFFILFGRKTIEQTSRAWRMDWPTCLLLVAPADYAHLLSGPLF